MTKRSGPSSTSRIKQNSNLSILSFGQMLTALRTEKELSQTALANSLDRSTSFISLLETGHRRPTRELIDTLAEALGLAHDSETKRELIRAAGYESGEIAGVVTRIVDMIADQTQIGESSKLIVRADLGGLIDGWLDYFRAQTRFEQGHFNDVVAQCQQLLERRQYSPALLTSVRMSLAEAMVQEGELRRASVLTTEAHATIEGLQAAPQWPPTLGAEIRALQGLIFVYNGNYPMGKTLIEQSVAMYQKALTNERIPEDVGYIGLGSSYKRLAQVALLEGEPQSAFTFCLTAEAYLYRASESEERTHWLHRTAEQKAWAYTELGDFSRAIALRKRTRDELQKAHDHYGVTRNHLYTGDDYLTRVRSVVEKALNELRLDPSLPIDLKRRNDAIRMALATPEAREWLDNAEQCYHDALQGLEVYGQHMLSGRCMSNLGAVFRYKALRDKDSKAAEAAQVHLVRALTQEQGIGHRRRLPRIYESLADLELDQGHFDNAQFYYRKGLRELDSYHVRSADDAASAQYKRISSALQAVEAHIYRQDKESGHYPVALPSPAERWRSLCKRLVDLALRFALSPQAPDGLIAYSSTADIWVERQYALDTEEGGRILLQNAISDALTCRLRAGMSPVGARTHELRHQEFTQAIQRARGPGALSWDLCCRPHIERTLQYSEMFDLVREQVSNALEFMESYKDGYRLDSSLYEIPLGFAVKRSHILIEIPPELTSLFLSRDEQDQHIGATLCYEFHNEAYAKDLTELFHEFVATAAEILDVAANRVSTPDWLRLLLESQAIPSGLTGGGFFPLQP